MITLFPINGKSQRFKDAGYTTPKQFLRLDGRRLLDLATASYPTLSEGNKTLFIIRPEYEPEFGFGNYIIIRQDTRGPVETILKSSVITHLKTDEDLLIADSDSFLNKQELVSALGSMRKGRGSGGVLVRRAQAPNLSYARLDRLGFVLETREKDPFSEWSTTGPYWFRHAKDFLNFASEALLDGIFSVSPVYNYLIKNGLSVQAIPVKTFHHLGTPEELSDYVKHYGVTLS